MKSTNIYKTKPNETEAWFTLPFMPAGQEMDRELNQARSKYHAHMQLITSL